MQPVDVLVRIDPRQQGKLVQTSGLLDQKRSAGGIGIQLVDHCLDLSLSRGRWKVAANARDSDFGAIPVLRADVPAAGWVVTNQNRAEAGNDSAGRQLPNPFGQFAFDVGQDGSKVGELLGQLRWLAGMGIQTVIGFIPRVDQITPLEILGREVIPAVAEL